MNKAFSRILARKIWRRPGKVRKTGLHNHGVAGADPAFGRGDSRSQVFSPDNELTDEIHVWVSSNRISTRSSGVAYCGPRLLARPGTDWCIASWAMT